MKRACVFIDGSNFYHNLKAAAGSAKLDFYKFGLSVCKAVASKLGEEVELARIYYYNAPVDASVYPDAARAQQRFFDALKFVPKLDVKLGRLERRKVRCPACKEFAEIVCKSCGTKNDSVYVEKEVDVTLAVDTLSFARNNIYDEAVLVSDDGDFASVLREVKALAKTAVFVGFGPTQALIKEADLYVRLNRDFFKGLIRN